MAWKESVTIQDAIALLNEAVRLDPEAVNKLVHDRVECNIELGEHPTIQCDLDQSRPYDSVDNPYFIGLLGFINGLFGVNEKGIGAIGAISEEETGAIAAFVKSDTPPERFEIEVAAAISPDMTFIQSLPGMETDSREAEKLSGIQMQDAILGLIEIWLTILPENTGASQQLKSLVLCLKNGIHIGIWEQALLVIEREQKRMKSFGQELTPAEAEKVRQRFQNAWTGDHRGEAIIEMPAEPEDGK